MVDINVMLVGILILDEFHAQLRWAWLKFYDIRTLSKYLRGSKCNWIEDTMRCLIPSTSGSSDETVNKAPSLCCEVPNVYTLNVQSTMVTWDAGLEKFFGLSQTNYILHSEVILWKSLGKMIM